MHGGSNRGPAGVRTFAASRRRGDNFCSAVQPHTNVSGLRISITKNTAVLHRIPSGRVGLTEWYPNARSLKPKKVGASTDDVDAADDGADYVEAKE